MNFFNIIADELEAQRAENDRLTAENKALLLQVKELQANLDSWRTAASEHGLPS